MNSREFKDRLTRRARRVGVTVSPVLADRLETYFRLLSAWNARINLTALPLDDPTPETFDRLLVEPLVAAQYVSRDAARMMDVGSGGGSPAIPLALACPGVTLLMVEARVKKSVFLLEAIRALELPGAAVAAARLEQLLTKPSLLDAHDLVTIRAVRVDRKLLSAAQRFLKPAGQLFLFGSSETAEFTFPGLRRAATHKLVDMSESGLTILQRV